MNNRTFVIVVDSLGIGSDERSYLYGDDGANTLGHMFEATQGRYKIPTLQKLGLCNLIDVKGNERVDHPLAYITKMHEASIGKDTMTGHWEMMGLKVTEPFQTFTDTGFPDDTCHRDKCLFLPGMNDYRHCLPNASGHVPTHKADSNLAVFR